MKATIEGSPGSGDKAGVDERYNLAVSTASEALKANLRGDCYSVLSDITTAAGATQDFFYLKNNDSRDLVIFKIEGWHAAAKQEIAVYLGATDAGTDAGDVLTPINMNTAYGNNADVDCTQDATELAITGGSVVALLKFSETALLLRSFDFPAGIILASGTRLFFQDLTIGLHNMNVYFYFRE